jgi:hypothetical protein
VVFACGSVFRPHPNGHDCPPAISHHSTKQQNKPFQQQFDLEAHYPVTEKVKRNQIGKNLASS